MTTFLAGGLGIGFATGLILIARGVRGHPAGAHDVARWAVWWRRYRQRISPGWLAAGVASGLFGGLITGWVVGGVLVALAAWALPRVLGGHHEHADRVARIEAIAAWTEMLRDTLAAAAGLEQAILATMDTSPEAIRDDVRRLAVGIQRGDRLADALKDMAVELDDPTADLVISALVLAAQHPARQLADLLGELAGEAREQVSMRLRVEAGRSRTRTSVRVIVTATLVFAVGLIIFNRSYLAPYDGAFGQIMLLVVGVLFGLSFWWLNKISHLTQPQRFLTDLAASDPARREVRA